MQYRKLASLDLLFVLIKIKRKISNKLYGILLIIFKFAHGDRFTHLLFVSSYSLIIWKDLSSSSHSKIMNTIKMQHLLIIISLNIRDQRIAEISSTSFHVVNVRAIGLNHCFHCYWICELLRYIESERFPFGKSSVDIIRYLRINFGCLNFRKIHNSSIVGAVLFWRIKGFFLLLWDKIVGRIFISRFIGVIILAWLVFKWIISIVLTLIGQTWINLRRDWWRAINILCGLNWGKILWIVCLATGNFDVNFWGFSYLNSMNFINRIKSGLIKVGELRIIILCFLLSLLYRFVLLFEERRFIL